MKCFLGRFLKSLRKDFQDKLAHASSTADESFGNVITVRSFCNEGKMLHQYSQDINDSYKLGKRLAFLTGSFIGTVSMFMYVSEMNIANLSVSIPVHSREQPL